MLSTLCWVPRGGMKATPKKYEPTAEELAAAAAAAKESEDDAGSVSASDVDDAAEPAPTPAPAPATSGVDADGLPLALNMDAYDDSDEEEEDEAAMDMAADLKPTGDMFYPFNAEDPNLGTAAGDDVSDSEDEDFAAKLSDAFVLVGNTEEDASIMELHVYDEEQGSLFVHHDFALPAFPLAVEWMDCPPTTAAAGAGSSAVGSFAAIGTFLPGIEIWDLDVVDAMEPVAVLGGQETQVSKGRRRGKRGGRGRPQLKAGSHKDSVMGLSWNREHRSTLASASADASVKVWDITTQKCVHTLTHHVDKVQCVKWHPTQHTMMLTGSFDKTAAVLDAASPGKVAKFALPCDIESAAWDPFNQYRFMTSCEDGSVLSFDYRNASKPVFTVKAHEKAASSVTFSPLVRGLVATASIDKSVKLWDIEGDTPACVGANSMSIGEIFCCGFYMHSPWILAAGGSRGMLAIWDVSENVEVERRFKSRVVTPSQAPWTVNRLREDGPKPPTAEEAAAAAAAAAEAASGAGAGAGAGAAANVAMEGDSDSDAGAGGGPAAGAGAGAGAGGSDVKVVALPQLEKKAKRKRKRNRKKKGGAAAAAAGAPAKA